MSLLSPGWVELGKLPQMMKIPLAPQVGSVQRPKVLPWVLRIEMDGDIADPD